MASLLSRRRKPRIRLSGSRQRALLASARKVDEKTAKELPKLRQSWQEEAYGYYDSLGACRYPAQFTAYMLSRVRLFVGVRDASGEVEESEDERELALLDPLADQDGGHKTLLGSYGQQMFVTGECFLVNTMDPDSEGEERYELLSPLEFRVKPDGRDYVRQLYPGKNINYRDASQKTLAEPLLADEVRVWRLWRKHPAYSGLADSPVHSVLGLYEEMLMLQLAARSRVHSRLARSGILLYAGEISLEQGTPQDPDEDPESDLFFAELIKHVQAAITDPGSASSIAPLVGRVDTGGRPISDLVYHLKLFDTAEDYTETQRQQEVLKQIALGIDLPPEILLGISDTNHWGAWMVDDQTWQAHGEGLALGFASDLSAAYLRPLARSQNLARADELVIGIDPAAVVTDPDRSKNAQLGYVDGVLSAESYRDSIDFSEDDAPSPEEHAEWVAIKMRDQAFLPSTTSAPTAEDTGTEPDAGPPAQAPTVTASTNGDLNAMVRGAGTVALQRARELAGSRIRSRKDSCPDCFEGTDKIPNELLASELQADVWGKIGAPHATKLVAGAARPFVAALVGFGVDGEDADALGQWLESLAARTLCDEIVELPSEFGANL